MTKVLTDSYERTPWQRFWKFFKKQDLFTRLAVISLFLLLLATPIVITTQMLLTQYAAEITYISPKGTGVDSLFTISDLEAVDITPYTASITWNTSAPATGLVHYWQNDPWHNFLALFYKANVNNGDFITQHSIQIPPTLKPNTSYHYKIYTATKFGDKFESSTYTFKTLKE